MDIITGTVSITCLVMVMMLLIEFVNVSSSGHLLSKLQKRPYLQVLVASLLGLIPGCIGGFTIVSLYTHRLLSFGALVAGMISTFGDSAFLLFAMSPRTAPVLLGSLFGIALVAGVVTHLLFRNRPFYSDDPHTLEVHQGHEHGHGKAQLSWQNIKKMSFSRAILIFGLVLYLTALGTGAISHEHGSMFHGENLVTLFLEFRHRLHCCVVVRPIHRLRGAECGLGDLLVGRTGRDAAEQQPLHRKGVAGAEHRADIVHAAHVVHHHYQRDFLLRLEFLRAYTVQFVH